MLERSFEKSLTTTVGALLYALLLFAPSASAQRLAPPTSLECDANHLTSFTGRILSYQRKPGRVSLRMRTDEETTESFTLKFGRNEDAARWYLLRGEPFKRSDWAVIEGARNRLRSRMRATVWVCDDGSNPVIDWRPGVRVVY